MADIRINALATTAASTASDDFIAIDGSANGTRKLNAYSPTFGGNLTVSGTGTSSVGGKWLVGTGGVDSGALLQVGTNTTTSAGGMVFGTNTFLYRTGAGSLAINGGVVDPVFRFYNGATQYGYLQMANSYTDLNAQSGTLYLKTSNSIALTLDSSQNATFAGKVTAGTWADVVSARLGVATSANSYTATIANNASSGGAYALRLHTTGTASSDYIVVGSSGSSAGSVRFLADGAGNFVVNNAAIATTATDGFLYVATCAGTPTGTPTSYTGRAPIVVDTTNNKLYFYSSGAWRDAGP